MSKPIPVVLEAGAKRVFAGALDWPGWWRSGRSEDAALEALAAYGARYANVVRRAGGTFLPPSGPEQLLVTERLPGGSGTDFGVPSAPTATDGEPLDDRELERLTGLLAACWATFDDAARAARGVQLSVGPRGGGRTLDKIVAHLAEAEEAYLGQLGARLPPEARTARTMEKLRAAMLDAVAARAHGRPVAVPRNTLRPWSPRYTIRRSAWHALDHAWEIEDRST